MQNIVFCAKCGAYIPSKEISSGSVVQANNAYYHRVCPGAAKTAPAAPATQARPAAPARPAVQPQAARPMTPVNRPPAPRPAVPPTPHIASRIQQPAAPRPAPAGQRPVAAAPSRLRQPVRPVLKSRIPPPEYEPEAEEPQSRFSQKPPKKSFTKFYVAGGALVIVVIIVIIIVTSMKKNALKEAEDKRYDAAKEAYTEIKTIDRAPDSEEKPEIVLKSIKDAMENVKGTEFEEKVLAVEKSAKERQELLAKLRGLDENPIDAEKLDEIEAKILAYTQLKDTVPSDYARIGNTIRDKINSLKKMKTGLLKNQEETKKKQEQEEEKAYEAIKTKIESLKTQNAYEELVKTIDGWLAKPGNLKYQEELDPIKEEAQKAIDEKKQAEAKRRDWQKLNEDQANWKREGSSETEFYVDENLCMIVKSPKSGNNQGAALVSEQTWKNFKMEITFKVLSGSFGMNLRGQIPIPFPKKFGSKDWQTFIIEVEGTSLTITEKGQEPKNANVANGEGPVVIIAKPGDSFEIKELKVIMIN